MSRRGDSGQEWAGGERWRRKGVRSRGRNGNIQRNRIREECKNNWREKGREEYKCNH